MTVPPFPRTFIQVHYHDRPCGVVRVMRHYARAFALLRAGKPCRTFLVCAHDTREHYPEFPGPSIIHLSVADYREFESAQSFQDARDKIMDSILSLLSSGIETPAAIVGHNLSLCKNAALVSAFAELSRRFRNRTGEYRFFSVVHDCAEEGRVEQLRQITALEAMGIKIRRDISMTGGAVRHVAINTRVGTAFASAGLTVSLLRNPVTADRKSPPPPERCMKRLVAYCRKKGIPFDRNKRVYGYPSRTIARKNPLEAMVFACILKKGVLLLGLPGSTEKDRRLHGMIKDLAKKHRLPVVTDIQNIADSAEIYGVSDAVVTTSVAEGFGYLLFDPFLYGKGVVGRWPIGLTYPSCMDRQFLYKRLPVPAGWFPLSRLRKTYQAIGRQCLVGGAGRRQFLRQAARLGSSGTIDFAALDDALQLEFVKKLLSSDTVRNQWLEFLELPRQGWPGLGIFEGTVPPSVCHKNRREILRRFSMRRFVAEFTRCFSMIPAVSCFVRRAVFEEKICDIRTFRIR